MGFRYTSPPLTQGITSIVVVGAGLALMAMPGAVETWDLWLQVTPPWFHVLAMLVVLHGIVFWGLAAGFGYVNRYNKPAFIAKHRIQSGAPRQPPLRKTLVVLAWNQLVWSPLMLAAMWGVLHLRGWSPAAGLPDPIEVLIDLTLLTISATIYFYASHRFLHRPWWMKRVHRVHHEFRTTSVMASEYAHPIEIVFANFGTVAIGVVLFAPHLATIYLFTVVSTITFVGHHSGYAVPWMSWAVHHDWHHYRYKEAFGTFGVIDHVLRTDAEFRTLEDGQEVT